MRALVILCVCAFLAGCGVRYPTREIIKQCAGGNLLMRVDGVLSIGRFDRAWGWFDAPLAKDADLKSLCP